VQTDSAPSCLYSKQPYGCEIHRTAKVALAKVQWLFVLGYGFAALDSDP